MKNDMKILCFFAIAVLLAAGCSKEVAPMEKSDMTEIKVGNGPGKLDISINTGDENLLSKSVDEFDGINSCCVLVGPYENGKYGDPLIYIKKSSSFTLAGLEEGTIYIAALVNPQTIPQTVNSVEELYSGKWTMGSFTGPKSGISYATIVKNSTTKAKVKVKRCYGTVYIEKAMDSCTEILEFIGHRSIYLDEIYLQNVPSFGTGYYWGWENGMPKANASGEDNWFNPSETIGTTSNSLVSSLTCASAKDKYTISLKYKTFCSPPNTTSRKPRLVIKAHYSDNDSESLYSDCYYTINLPSIKPNTRITFKSIELVGIGGETPDDYKGQSNVKYSVSIDNWESGGTISEEY